MDPTIVEEVRNILAQPTELPAGSTSEKLNSLIKACQKHNLQLILNRGECAIGVAGSDRKDFIPVPMPEGEFSVTSKGMANWINLLDQTAQRLRGGSNAEALEGEIVAGAQILVDGDPVRVRVFNIPFEKHRGTHQIEITPLARGITQKSPMDRTADRTARRPGE
jgi:hypothetical protein